MDKTYLSYDKAEYNASVRQADDLSQAIDRGFEYGVDGMSWKWGDSEIRICYVYGVSDLLENLLEMLEALVDRTNGSVEVVLATDGVEGIDCDLRLKWEDEALDVEAEWRSAPGAEAARLPTRMRLSRMGFVDDWLSVLVFLSNATADVVLECDEERQRVDALKRICGQGRSES